jgi:CBS domain-containing protein
MKLMYEKKIRRIIILDHDRLAGIITDKDIFRYLVENKDLLSDIITSGDLPIPENRIKDEMSHFWFFNNFVR